MAAPSPTAPSPTDPAAVTPIHRLLIANRGEIAVRIARTASRLGIATVGVYSEPDARALHVGAVDLAVALGGATPAESYLDIDAVLRAVLDTGCDAVHPGYGFLAEHAGFARAVRDAGLVWVGPTPEQIELLGDKIAAKAAALRAGVPTTGVITIDPGQVPDGVVYPALVKAAAGGGGRGMRVVRSGDELPGALESASREAQAAFGDGTVFIEPYIEHGRHIEVQVFGDAHGNVIHLGDRDCSIQRRNQKVVEEAPAVGLSDGLRQRLHDGAVALAREVGYQGAGTVEFLVGGSDGAGSDEAITFLEVNTRLQVEHPVTEAVTGLDLVELQLTVATGAPLPLTQRDVRIDGHAIEVRLVAEDPATGWLPSTGTIEQFSVPGPSEMGAMRCDTGVAAGSEIGADYDSLLAKVIAHAPHRVGAARLLARALRHSVVVGPRTNLATLVAVLEDADFLDAPPSTDFLATHPQLASALVPSGHGRDVTLVAAVLADERRARRADALWGFAPSGWRNLAVQGQRSTWIDLATGDERQVELEVHDRESGQDDGVTVRLGDSPVALEDGSLGPDDRTVLHVRRLVVDGDDARLEVDGVTSTVRVTVRDDVAVASGPTGSAAWRRAPRFPDHDTAGAGSGPVAPLPGTVVSVHVQVGATVADGDALVVVEAMKMEHTVRASIGGTVTEVRVAAGDRVDAGEMLIVVEAVDT